MTAINMTIKYFDTLEYVKESKRITDPGELAAYQVTQFESAIETAVQFLDEKHKDAISKEELQNFATKADVFAVKEDVLNLRTEIKADVQSLRTETKADIHRLEVSIHKLRYKMIKFVLGVGVSSVLILIGFMGHGFHWF